MKKLTERYKRWLIHRAAYEARKPAQNARNRKSEAHIVHMWTGEEFIKALSKTSPITPPQHVCFHTHPEASISFLDSIRGNATANLAGSELKNYQWYVETNKDGNLPTIKGYADFSKIEEISTAACVVLAAEYDRQRTRIGRVPPTINLHDWTNGTFKKLFEIGFFEIVGLAEGAMGRSITEGNLRSMPIATGSNAKELRDTCERIASLSQFIDPDGLFTDDVQLALNSALAEAMINVGKHAYPKDHDFVFQHINKWWVTATAHKVKRELTVVIYDQGASIPVTFPRKDLSKTVLDFLSRAVVNTPRFAFENDGAYIEGAMRPGKSQTNQTNRGLGLPEMKDLIDICGDGSLSIYSRGGVCYYEPNKPIRREARQHSIGGTLIEWTLKFP